MVSSVFLFFWLNKEELLLTPPLFGTTRAGFLARGSRLESPNHVTMSLDAYLLK